MAAGSFAPSVASPRATAAVLRIPFPQYDGTLTPYTFNSDYSLMTLLYDTVMWRDAGGIPRPWLADSVATSADGMTVNIHVAPGARWQDGPPVTSADIAFTFTYMRAHPHERFTPELAVVSSVDTPDPATAVIHLSHTSSGFDEEPLSDVPIMPEHIWSNLPADALSPEGMPVGSGPYKLASASPANGYRFEAVNGYFRGTPAVQTIEVPLIHDAAATTRALQDHKVDALPISVSPNDALQLQRDLSVRVKSGASFLGTVLLMNTRSSPFDRPGVRRAVSDALNLAQIASAVGQAVPADRGYLHPDSGWAPSGPVQHYDPPEARLGLSGVDTPITVLAPDNDTTQQAAGRQVVEALERAGVNSKLTTVSVSELNDAVGAGDVAPTYQLALWTAPALASYDPTLLGRLFGSGQPLNLTGYASQEFDADAARVDTASDPAARHAAVESLVDRLAQDAPAVPLYFAKGEFAVRPGVYDGWVFVTGSGILDKLSFVVPAAPRPGDVVSGADAGSSNGSGSAGVPFSPIAASLALAAAVIAGYGAFRWLRRA
ncbi:MAG: hypothetical protein JOZ75_11070 [Candidatus Dormibacteraeota bacterium]|nr:hypothetical protein [Candidatus Dormibacteraeota bacterium]